MTAPKMGRIPLAGIAAVLVAHANATSTHMSSVGLQPTEPAGTPAANELVGVRRLPSGGTEDRDRVRSALASLDAKDFRDYGSWRNIGFAVKDGVGDDGFAIFDEWSQTDPASYDSAAVRKLWDSAGQPTGGITVATLYHHARQAGWKDTTQVAQTSAAGAAAYGTTDTDNAKRLAAMVGDRVKSCPALGAWVHHDDGRWQKTDEPSMRRLAQTSAVSIFDEAKQAAAAGNEGLAGRLSKWANSSLQLPRLDAAVELLKSVPGVTTSASDWDADPLTVQTRDGWVVDLRMGTARAATPADRLLRALRAGWDPSAACPVWLQTLDDVFQGDALVIEFFRRLAGYMLTGLTTEQVFVFLYGTGANGKSLVLNTLRELMGDYGAQTQPETLMVQKNANPGGASPHIARLAGIRLLSANETGEGQRLDEALVKQATGGDPLAARVPYGQVFEFTPVFKLVMAGNYRPVIRGDDHGIWRRILLVPFNRRFAPHEQDRDLPDKLRAEFPGILNWMIDGAQQWRAQGLNAPAAIRHEVDAYRSDMDVLGQWLADECVAKPHATYVVAAAYSDFTRYMAAGGGACPSKTRFAEKLKARGFTSVKGSKGVRQFIGFTRRPGTTGGVI